MQKAQSPAPEKKTKKIYPPADTNLLVEAIGTLRKGLGLSQLKNMLDWKESVPSFMNDKLDPTDIPYAILSRMYFEDSFHNEPTNVLLDQWLDDPGKRAVLFAPGNYSYINVDPEENKVTVLILSLLRPKTK